MGSASFGVASRRKSAVLTPSAFIAFLQSDTLILPRDVNDACEARKPEPDNCLADLEKNVQASEKKLSNAKFVKNAPGEVVVEGRRRLERAEWLIRGTKGSLAQLE